MRCENVRPGTTTLEGAYQGLQLNQPRRAAACKGCKQFAGTGKLVLWQACFPADTVQFYPHKFQYLGGTQSFGGYQKGFVRT